MKNTDRQMIYKILHDLENKNIPYKYPSNLIDSIDVLNEFRESIIYLQGFSLVCNEWIEPLAEWIGDRKCLEIMAGLGTITYALKSQGVDIVATDNYSWSDWISDKNKWCDVIDLDCLKAIESYGKDIDIIIMSWCYLDDMGFLSLEKMREINKDCIMIFIGDNEYGLIGNKRLYKSMVIINDSTIEEINKIYPRWKNINDKIYIIR